MNQGTILDRRAYRDRRQDGASTYTGPERRKLHDRRSRDITVCVFCERLCGGQQGWIKASQHKDADTDFLVDVCTDCTATQFPHVYTRQKTA